MQLGGAMVIWGTLYFGINIMLNCPVYQMNISSYIECIFGVWYLWTLLVISCVVAIAEKFMMGKFHILICVIAIPLLLLFYKGTSIIYMYPYFLIGYFTKKNIEKIDMLLKKGGNILIAFFPILLLYFRGDVRAPFVRNPFATSYGVIGQVGLMILRYFIGLCGSLFVILIVKNLNDVCIDKKCTYFFKELGKVSLQVYVMQRIVVELLGGQIAKSIIDKSGINLYKCVPQLYSWFFCLLITIICTWLIYKIIGLIKKHEKINKILFLR